jgi:ABC-2 type transport system permease protein
VPLVILPLVTFAAICAMHTVLVLMSVAARLVQGQGLAPWWSSLQLFRLWGTLLYAVVVMTLWHAPIHGFLLLVSGWARRTAALWAILPLLALGVIEYLTMNTMHVAAVVEHRVHGWYTEAFAVRTPERVLFSAPSTPDIGGFLATPGLWIGLALAAVFIAAAMRMRRYREPI